MGTPPIEATSWWQAMMTWMGLIVTPEQTDALPPALSYIEMGIKHCGRWALYGSSEVAGVSVSGRTSCRSVGGRRFSDGVLNSNGSELG